jgi:hypothetical protein
LFVRTAVLRELVNQRDIAVGAFHESGALFRFAPRTEHDDLQSRDSPHYKIQPRLQPIGVPMAHRYGSHEVGGIPEEAADRIGTVGQW